MTTPFSAALGAELTKLRRSLSWSVVVLLPVVVVLAGSFTTVVSGQQLADGWHTLWLRSVVFYGLLPLPLGLGILASLAWRPEHRGGSWNALMSSPVPSLYVVLAKTLVVALLGAVMQLVLLVTVVLTGKLLFGLAGMLPGRYLVITVLLVVAVLPVAGVQSALSMAVRSFATPVAVALVGAGTAAVLLAAELGGVVLVLPWAVTARATQLATGTFGDSGELTAGGAAAVVVAGALLTLLAVALATRYLERRDVHT
ncbi:ABC transporter [Auraticoccus sp. F435]|uniref:ABC transporter n=1 Tax=Auraticoccus cholistanensis TaxID=2656650 RepID=A0A6A9USH5_9ACTN|nr:ABC transporter permease [Auraticoccus cholistanensis]MVA74524.1 ABC transporter [Auraticoccus cholistanensis]